MTDSPEHPDNPDLLIKPKTEMCHSIHMQKWLGGLYAYKGFLLLFGVYMAYETRNVKIAALNDSQYIGMSVYNVVIISIIVVVISNIVMKEHTLVYVLIASLILLSTTVTLCFTFVPKILTIVKCPDGDPVLEATGLKMESRTRRFAGEDRRELLYRAEVQNRVYKRELTQLDKELNRLQHLLELPIEPYQRISEELLHLLPESNVDATPQSVRKSRQARCQARRRDTADDNSTCHMSLDMSEIDEALTDVPDIDSCQGILARQAKRKLDREDSGIHTMSFRSGSNRINHESDSETSEYLLAMAAPQLPPAADTEVRTYRFRSPRADAVGRSHDYLELTSAGPLDEIDESAEDRRRSDDHYRVDNGVSLAGLFSSTIPTAPNAKTTKLDLPLTFENTRAIRGVPPPPTSSSRGKPAKGSAIAALCARTIPDEVKKQRREKLCKNLDRIQSELNRLEDTVTYV
ncbi:PREDICTED: uncharacterized protein LOC106815477 [Priapulus caudatus]|uniref:Uncharacterized protein LOC106815477 n=1 Tax=Priapulus caudatus TaxID=37621 RepID=A0ABM1ETA7_PRICU|nr:PREDICTED: uncharacterized protein LOC106815477 [Priapulus caudatus]